MNVLVQRMLISGPGIYLDNHIPIMADCSRPLPGKSLLISCSDLGIFLLAGCDAHGVLWGIGEGACGVQAWGV